MVKSFLDKKSYIPQKFKILWITEQTERYFWKKVLIDLRKQKSWKSSIELFQWKSSHYCEKSISEMQDYMIDIFMHQIRLISSTALFEHTTIIITTIIKMCSTEKIV